MLIFCIFCDILSLLRCLMPRISQGCCMVHLVPILKVVLISSAIFLFSLSLSPVSNVLVSFSHI